ncbi:MAG: IS5 family transposase [Caldilineaceae bacterium SB0665_bin_21]|nr:IS5 family transposase [Caldilineaceae bacterium SB0665_bin_21]
MNEVVGRETIIRSMSHSLSQPLCHGPSCTALPRIQDPAPSAATGPGGARGLAPRSPPLPARGSLPPAHRDPVAGPARPLRTMEQSLLLLPALVLGRGLGTTGGGLRRGTGATVSRVPGHHPCAFPPGLRRCPAGPGPQPGWLRQQVAYPRRCPGGLLACCLTPGQAHDRPQAEGLLEGFHPDYVLADRSYDDDDLRRYIVAQRAEPVIPGRRNRREPIAYDRVLYRERNIVERSIGWLKQGRRIAICYEKTAASYLGFVLFAAARHWLRNPFANVHTPRSPIGKGGTGKPDKGSRGPWMVRWAPSCARRCATVSAMRGPPPAGWGRAPRGGVAGDGRQVPGHNTGGVSRVDVHRRVRLATVAANRSWALVLRRPR